MAPGQVSGTLPIWTNTVEKRGPVRDKTHANIMLGARLGSFQINLQFCWPCLKGVLSTWYIFATMGTWPSLIVGNVYHPTWGVLGRTGARFPYCWAETEAQSPNWSPAAARPVPGRPKRALQVCMSRTRDGSRWLETATGFRVL